MSSEYYIERSTHLTQAVGHLIENACDEEYLSASDINTIDEQWSICSKSGDFWVEQKNYFRMCYDIQNFAHWLCTFIESKEKDFFNEIN